MTLQGWNNSINIQLYSNETLTNYQVKFIVHRTDNINFSDNIYIGENCEYDYRDIRFTSTNDEVYPLWIESSNELHATIWIKIPSIIANEYTDIILQYNNSEATTISSGDDTFDFFDDFASGTIDTSKWTIYGTPIIEDSQIKISESTQGITTINPISTSTSVLRCKVNRQSTTISSSSFIGLGNSGQREYVYDIYGGHPDVYHINAILHGTSGFSLDHDGEDPYIYDLCRSDIICEIYDNGISYGILSNGTSSNLHIHISSDGDYPTYIDVDWVLIRKYSVNEPTKYYPQPFTYHKYKRSHLISSDITLTDYQVILTIYNTNGNSSGNTVYLNGKCKNDFSDIRFTDDNKNEIPYWIETITEDHADIWVKIPYIDNLTRIWLYYGNDEAITTSNGDDTFIFFDDFETGTINQEKWPIGYNDYSLTQNGAYNGYSVYKSGAEQTLKSKPIEPLINHVVEFKVKFTEPLRAHLPFESKYNSLKNRDIGSEGRYWEYNNILLNKKCLANIWYKIKIILNKNINTQYIYINNELIGTILNNNFNTEPDFYSMYTLNTGGLIYVDDIFIHKYSTTLPIHVSWSNERSTKEIYTLHIEIIPSSGNHPLTIIYDIIIKDPISDFKLNFGDSKTYTLEKVFDSFTITHTYDTPGTYTVFAEGYDEDGSNHVFYEIPYGVTINAQPVVASFDISQTYNTIQFTNTSTGLTNEFYWIFGDGNVSYEENPMHTYHTTGTYNVKLHASNQYQYDDVSSPLTITQILVPPKAYFKPNEYNVIAPRLPHEIHFTNLSIPDFGCTYLWLIDGTPYYSKNATHSFDAYGSYDISLQVTNALGTNIKSYEGRIKIVRKGRTFIEQVGTTDSIIPFAARVFIDECKSADKPPIYAKVLAECVEFIQKEIPEKPGIDEWGHRNLYSTINEWGHRIISKINEWGHKILHPASANDHSPLTKFRAKIFDEIVIFSDEWEFDDP